MIYLNHAGISWPKPASVVEAVVEALSTPPETWGERLAVHHAEVCQEFGVADPNRLLLTTGATSALAVAVADHAWESGDRIVISGLEHHALHRPVEQLTGRGVEAVVVPRSNDVPVCLEVLETELRRGRVRMVAMAAASNVTGEILPVSEITALAREYGAISLIDAAQTAGWIPIDAEKYGADLFAFTGHKGPQAPWGIGALYVAPQVTMASPGAVCEVPTHRNAAPCAPMPGFCDVGSVDRAALAGLVAGLRWLRAPERASRLVRARGQAARMVEAAMELGGVTLHGSAHPEARMPTLALSFKDRNPADAATALASRGVIAAAGLQCAPLAHETLGTSPDGVVRFSVGPSNDDDDIAAAIEALRDVARG
jgi:selenocysteine lyase/cysteine desulfurase